MGLCKDGSEKKKFLQNPGDVFVVNEHGWLMKTDEVNTLLMKYNKQKRLDKQK